MSATAAKTVTKTAKITAATRNTPLPEGAVELLIKDKDLVGFAIRIRPESARYIMSGRVAGTTIRRKITIGDAASLTAVEARNQAMVIRNQLVAGEDPVQMKPVEVEAPTFAEVAADYTTRWAAGKLGKRAPRPASVISAAKDIKRALATFGPMKISDIDTAAVRKFRAKLLAEDVSPAIKRRAFGALVIVMKHAHEIGHISDNPAASFAPPASSPARERYLKPEELAAVWEASATMGRPGDAVQFLISMPVRLSVARLMEWSWIDTENGTITIPASAVGNKAGEVFVLPMNDLAMEIILRQPTRTGLVLRGRGGGPVSLGSDVKDRLDTLSGVSDWRLHDLRRTVVTLLADADPEVDTDAADRWLQHRRSGIAAVYQRANRLQSMRRVADSWDRVLRKILGIATDDNVVTLNFAQVAK